MDYLISALCLDIVICLVTFLISVLITAWIIKIGVRWAIMHSSDDIKIAVSQGILYA
jgi:hypothetical protein